MSARSTRSRRRSFARRERAAGSAARPNQLNAYYTNTGMPDYFDEDLARYRSLDATDVPSSVQRFLPKDRRVELTVLPGDEVSDRIRAVTEPCAAERCALCLARCCCRSSGRCRSPAQAPDRSQPPALGPAPALRLPAMQKLHPRQRPPAVALEQHDVPLVQVEPVVLRAPQPMCRASTAPPASPPRCSTKAPAGKPRSSSPTRSSSSAQLVDRSSFDASVVRLSRPAAKLAERSACWPMSRCARLPAAGARTAARPSA